MAFYNRFRLDQTTSDTLFTFPLEILEKIFMNLPYYQVVHVCRRVCKRWRDVADGDFLWRELCRREGYHLRVSSGMPDDCRLFYVLCKNRRNLLKNPSATQGLDGWEILENGGDGWIVDNVKKPHQDDTIQKNFVTSYRRCMKSQLIDLEKEGYNPIFMDRFQPDIRISDWYSSRKDCGSLYEIRVDLLNERQERVHTFAPDTVFIHQWNDQKWHEMTHVFQNYGPGVRYIQFTHGGRDTQFWKGWYGIRVTASCVEVC